jgi:thioredoxin-related protein
MTSVRPAFTTATLLVVALLLASCDRRAERPAEVATVPAETPAPRPSPPASGPAPADAGIAWTHAANDAEVDAAFARARAESRPVFVYWGAEWCPPCNQVKATLFNRQDFIERSRAFVPVYVDGDAPGAQKLGSRFRVSGYPTMVLFSPQGQELTRLPGEVDPARYGELLDLGLNTARPVKAVLADALAGNRLATNDWRLLAFYSWDTDQHQVVAKDELAPTLAKLAAACPADQPETAMRLRLRALTATDAKAARPLEPTGLAAVQALLADPVASRAQADLLENAAAEIVGALAPRPSPQRQSLQTAFDAALRRLQADPTLSRADRMQALIARVDLARIDDPEDDTKVAPKPAAPPHIDAALVAEAKAEAARADREISNGYERQAVVTAAAYLLERVGLGRESDALLEANLAKSHSPYYLMSGLAGNARKRGDKAAAVDWYRKAFEASEGPATRLQWGASYVSALVELAPGDESAIESATLQVWKEAALQPDAFQQRSERSLQRIGTKLQAWNRDGGHAGSIARLQDGLKTLCASGPRAEAERLSCVGLLEPPTKGRT